MMTNTSKKPPLIEPVMLTEEWPNKQICNICEKRADKKITTFNAPDGIPRICWYCEYCIETEVPQFRTDTDRQDRIIDDNHARN